MKRLVCTLLACGLLCLCGGCSSPNDVQLNLYQGFGREMKLLHLNASSHAKEERMEAFHQVLLNAEPLEKEYSMFAYYPDYRLELKLRDSDLLTAIVDVNGEFIDFTYPLSANPEQIYRSHVTAQEFKRLVHQ